MCYENTNTDITRRTGGILPGAEVTTRYKSRGITSCGARAVIILG